MSEAIEAIINLLERVHDSVFPINSDIARGEFYREAEGDLADDEVPDFCGSIDAALKLVPEGWYWRVGRTAAFQAWAAVYETHPDHGEPGRNEFFWHREYWQPESTPPIALCIVALQARAAMQKRRVGKRGEKA